MIAPSPFRALAAALALGGIAIVLANRVDPDESRAVGAALIVLGAGFAATRETRWKQVTLELVATLLCVLAGGELAIRRENGIAQRAFAERMMHFVEDPELRYEMKPGIKHSEGTTNSFGMLDRERALAKPPGTWRVACLGDSVGGDFQLPDDNACAALERILAARRGGSTEVLNFAVPGYNTLQEARALEVKALRFDPDAIVVLFVVNDPYPDLAVSHFLPGHFKFEHLLWTGINLALGRSRFEELFDLFARPRAWHVVVSGFDRIAAVAAERKLPVVVAVFPLFTRDAAHFAPLYRKVVDEAARHGFRAVDLSAVYADHDLSTLLKPSRDPIHPNAAAHLLAAEAIARELAP